MITTDSLLKQYHAKRIKLSDGLQIINVSRNLVDVFIGNGWTNQSRLRQVKGNWLHIAGITLTNTDSKRVTECLAK